MFFDKTDRVHVAMRGVAEKLQKATIPHAIVGGMAVNAHGYIRTTADVDFLLTKIGLAMFRKEYVPAEFEPVAGHPRRFVDRATGVTVDILVTGLFPGNGKPGPIAYPDPIDASETIDEQTVLRLDRLIELKLAAGRHKDFGDVVELIRLHNLDEAYTQQLHESVRADFIECLEEKRREDEYETRQDRAFEATAEDLPPSS
jgi:hypothetical protein